MGTLAMQAISMAAKFGWDALAVGQVMMVMTIPSLFTGFFLTERVTLGIGAHNAILVGDLSTGASLMVMGYADDAINFLLMMAVSRIGMGLRFGSQGALLGFMTSPVNRGAVFAAFAMYQQSGM